MAIAKSGTAGKVKAPAKEAEKKTSASKKARIKAVTGKTVKKAESKPKKPIKTAESKPAAAKTAPSKIAKSKQVLPAAKAKPAKKPAAKKVESSGETAAAKKPATLTINQSVLIRGASTEEVYRAFLTSKSHAKITGGAAKISAKVDSAFSAWDGYISGKNLELETNKRIVQSWRTVEFPKTAPDSQLELCLEEEDGGTRIRLVQSGLPKSQAKAYELGWTQYYWGPMQKYFDDQDE